MPAIINFSQTIVGRPLCPSLCKNNQNYNASPSTLPVIVNLPKTAQTISAQITETTLGPQFGE
jgi:hypothetical protein